MIGGKRFFSSLAALLIACMLAAPGTPLDAAAAAEEAPALVAVLPDRTAEARLTLGDLRAMPWTTVRTRNRYNDRVVAYSGPLMRDVLAAVGLDRADVVRFTAANDYSVDIPTSDFHDWEVILAVEADGAPLPRRVTGPLWLIYPQSSHSELGAPIYDQRLIWQIIRLEAL